MGALYMKEERRVSLVSYGHVDPVWLWPPDEGMAAAVDTFRSVIARMNEFPDLRFSGSSAAFYQATKETDPKTYGEIKKRVEEGRWELVGGMWIEPDCNLPDGESFVRQLLAGQLYFQTEFGKIATVGFNPDSFGHTASLPKILAGAGIDSYIYMRPGPNEMPAPCVAFKWQSEDGSSVNAFHIIREYNSPDNEEELFHHIRGCAAEIKPPLQDVICFIGMGNHGGGPTRRMIEVINKFQNNKIFPDTDLVFTTAGEYFKSLSSNGSLPVFRGELAPHAIGAYSTMAEVKKMLRQVPNRLLAAEAFATVANRIAGINFDHVKFQEAWHANLFNQFHDIAAGTCQPSSYNKVFDFFGYASTIASQQIEKSTQAIVRNIRSETGYDTPSIVVFNPNCWPVEAPVEIEKRRIHENDKLLDSCGREIPYQIIQSETVTTGRDRIVFVAPVPALGYTTFKAETSASPAATQPAPPENNPEGSRNAEIENDRMRLEINRENGGFVLTDKKYQAVILKNAAIPVVIDDPSDTWGHGLYRYDGKVENFKPVKTEITEQGPVRSVVRVTSHFHDSTMIQDFMLYQNIDELFVTAQVDWHEKNRVLKLPFPVILQYRKAAYEIPYGHINRGMNGDEVSGQSWADISGEITGFPQSYGVSLINDSKYSYSAAKNVLSMTVLRSPVFAHHEPKSADENKNYEYVDQGLHKFKYAIFPHEGNWQEAHIPHKAREFNQTLYPLQITVGPNGSLSETGSFIEVDNPAIMITVFKEAEDGSGDLIIRGYETTDAPVEDATIRSQLLPRPIKASFGAGEILTFRIPRDPNMPFVQTNLLEEPIFK